MSLLTVLFCLSCCSLCSCFPCPSSPCFLPVGVSALLLPWLIRNTCPAFIGIQPTIYTLLGLLFSARVSCLFEALLRLFLLFSSLSWPFFSFVFLIVSLLCFCSGLMRWSSVSITSASPLVLLAIFDSGLFVLPWFLFSPSVVTLLVILECWPQSLFPLLVVLRVLWPLSLQTILLDSKSVHKELTWSVSALRSLFCDSWELSLFEHYSQLYFSKNEWCKDHSDI